jgi:hypothetical protein
MQFTTGGSFNGSFNMQIFENGLGENDIRKKFTFHGFAVVGTDGAADPRPDTGTNCLADAESHGAADA